MARNVIVGCSDLVDMINDKGERIRGLRLYLSRQALDTFGQKTADIWVKDRALEQIDDYLQDVSQLIGVEVDVDFTNKGKLENFQLAEMAV